jgi:protein-S-isoprenylcysteine O-methyltransferase Ste14
MVAGLVPWWITQWQFKPPLAGIAAGRAVGVALILIGLLSLVGSFARFAWTGLGTPAPIAPPNKLVVTGSYRRVRNPMYVALLVVLTGEALLFGDLRVFWWALIFWAGCHVFVTVYEEPTLKRLFGAEYGIYRKNVPRWLPRVRAWNA